ncbi:hypothetical protein K9U39_12285 [Rhodoblastus acidophilus]|uniref:Uncharacterized protein n=1 Tax=Candidatus Rhodoblastus alkanivorans TaxID=2954117 RepID=A0ABS9Z9X2_9HYPH|nr:hypothetical protein [Candidatus Rhodoblastus alkanivorans]MCI4680815.1 hypothetical protein [Candidatus Rhodoblastus alkanivorans]MCI4684387.1 hypothetical protein [Candidatus Rhodoblastus alkanivorans]MDI4641707.1 hypothetical protein [Rhodoblastus acidophilus]
MQNDDAPEFVLRAAKDAVFALFDDTPTVFCESAQKLYALNPVAALIWCCLDEGGGRQAAQARLVAAGVNPAAAGSRVEDAVRDWLELGLLDVDFHPAREPHACAFCIDGQSFTVETSSPRLSRQIAALFDHHPSEMDDAEATRIRVVEIDGRSHVYLDDQRLAVCSPEETPPAIKGLATERILAQMGQDIAFHAACLSQRGRALLISGEPGAGKTTLTLHLAAKGFGYGGDDVALISPAGYVRGLPCAAAVKPGAWDIVGQIRPELRDAPVWRRPDGVKVKYLEAGAIDAKPKPAGWIVFLRREAGGAVEFRRLDALEAMRRLIDAAFSPLGRLSLPGFGALRRVVTRAQIFELTYEHSAEAADAISAICHDGA